MVSAGNSQPGSFPVVAACDGNPVTISASGIQRFVPSRKRLQVCGAYISGGRLARNDGRREVFEIPLYDCVASHNYDLGVSMFTVSILSGTKRFLEWVQRTR